MTEEDLRSELTRLQRRIDREHRARLEAENLAEKGTRALYDRHEELQLLNAITDAANGAKSVNEAIQVSLAKICAYTKWPVGDAYFLGDDPDLLVPSGIWHLDDPLKFETFRQVTESVRLRRGEGLPGTVLATGRPGWIPEVQKEPNFPRAKQSEDLGVVAAFAFPVLIGAEVVAVLEFFSGERMETEETWLKISGRAGIQLGRIFERQRAAAQLEKAHLELVEVSRRAGMAEVATGVVHNIGNVLNSVSVSATLLTDQLKQSKIGSLRQAAKMLREQDGRLPEFLTTDPKGKMLPEYIGRAAEAIEKEQAGLLAEAGMLNQNIEHIKSIVAMQQHYAKGSLGITENLDAAQLVNDALRMHSGSVDRHHIRVTLDFDEDTPKVLADRHKVLQILINLIRNAKHAVEHAAHERRLGIRIFSPDAARVHIAISDNGVGIPPENLNRIFNHGFTTRETGHGFGLHSGANAAREMGGFLTAQSDGEGRGATFILDLPAARAIDTASHA